MNSLADGETSI